MMRRLLLACAAVAAVAANVVPAAAQTLPENREGVYGKVVDEAGNPAPNIGVSLVARGTAGGAMTVKTDNKGLFIYPRVEFVTEGYEVRFESKDYFILAYHFKTRRLGTREIVQDDEAPRVAPWHQDKIPALNYRGFNATIELTLGRVADHPGGPGQAQQQQQQQQKRELTIEEQAEEAIALGDYKTAAEKLALAIEKKPDDVDLLWRRAEVLAKSGDVGSALREAQGVLKKDPNRKGVRMRMAGWMADRGQLEAAVPLLEAEKGLDPQSVSVAKALASAYQQGGKKDEYAAEVERVLTLAPTDVEALLAMAGIKAEKGDFAAAEQLYQKVAAADPANAALAFYNAGVSILGKNGLGQEDRQRAAVALKKALELNPKYAKAHKALADCLLGLADYKGAREHYAAFIDLAPQDPEAAQLKDLIKALPK